MAIVPPITYSNVVSLGKFWAGDVLLASSSVSGLNPSLRDEQSSEVPKRLRRVQRRDYGVGSNDKLCIGPCNRDSVIGGAVY